MVCSLAISNQAIFPGIRHLVVEDSLVRDLNEIFVKGQTTVLIFGGASVAQVIEDHLDSYNVSRAPVTPEGKWEPLLVCFLNELKEKYRPRLVSWCCARYRRTCRWARRRRIL